MGWLGNLGNVGFSYVKLLNKQGINATLFLNQNELKKNQPGNPNHEFKGAANEKFVEIYKRNIIKAILRKIGFQGQFDTYLIKAARQCNIIQAQTTAEIVANKLKSKFKIPYAAMTTGSDLSEVAFEDTALGESYRKALREASHLFLLNIDQFKYLKDLSLQDIPHSFLPFNVNVSEFTFQENIIKDKIVIFSIARLDWESKTRKSIKRNDIFFKGFAKFIKENRLNNFELWISDHGIDRKETRNLISELGIGHISKFVPHCERSAVYKLLKSAHIIVDQFSLGATGLSAIEAMASSRPVMAYCNCEYARYSYGKDCPPFINCRTEEDVFNNLNLLSKEYIKQKSRESFEWVKRNHSEELITQRLKSVYYSILKK